MHIRLKYGLDNLRFEHRKVHYVCRISEQKPGVLDELAAERKKLLEKESAELEADASRLSEEIKELSGQAPEHIS